MNRLKALLVVAAIVAALAPLEAQVGKSVGLLDANRATQQELTGVPHLNADLVKAIMDKRPFANVTELGTVLASLTPQQRTEVYGKLFVHLNLNTATREQILLIPNAGPRMAHEFEEYRPYKALAQFHREIDKYVDDVELARLEQYVFVPINLNTASDADILTIPGLGNRMLHEFKEYRPYKAIEQFRREIGKYVDKKEVARLERYVVIN